MEHTILILILPFLSFLILGLAGMRMKNGLAGTIGTVSLAGVTLLSKSSPKVDDPAASSRIQK